MITIGIIAVLAIAFYFVVLRPKGKAARRERDSWRDNDGVTLSRDVYLKQLRMVAKDLRCPHPAFTGNKSKACKRAPGRPCVRGCRGRLDIETNWTGD